MNTSVFLLIIPNPIIPLCSVNSFLIVSHSEVLPKYYADLQTSVDILPSNVNILDGTVEDLVGECNAYEKKIKSYGGIELFLGGIGEDGHIAFNVSSTQLLRYSWLTDLYRNLVSKW